MGPHAHGRISVNSGESQEKWAQKRYVRAHGGRRPNFKGGGRERELFMEGFLEELLTKPRLPQAGVRARRRRGRVEMGALAEGREWPSLRGAAAVHTQRQRKQEEPGEAERTVTGLSVILWRARSRGRLLNRKEA